MSNRVFARWQSHPGRVLLILVLLALLLRGWNLGGKSLWLDEAFGVINAESDETAALNPVDGNNPPLYYTGLHYWVQAFGRGEATVRLPSMLISMVNLGLFYLLARRLFSRDVALTATALLALSPVNIWYAQETRMYAFLVTAGLLMALGLAWEHWLSGLLLFAGLGAGLWLGYLAFPLWIGLSAIWLILWWQRGHKAWRLLLWAVASAAGWWVYRPWWPTFQNWLDHRLAGHWIVERTLDLFGLPPLTSTQILLLLVAGAVGIVVGGMLLRALLQRRQARRLLTLVAVLGFVAFLILTPIPRLYSAKRVLLPGWPFVILLVAWLVMKLDDRRDWVRGGLLGLSFVLAIVTLAVPKDDWRGATEHVAENAADDAVVWLDPGWNELPYRYYRPGIPYERGNLEHLETVAATTDDIWLIAERYPGDPIPASPSEQWLDQQWQLVEAIPFYRLEVRHYRPN